MTIKNNTVKNSQSYNVLNIYPQRVHSVGVRSAPTGSPVQPAATRAIRTSARPPGRVSWPQEATTAPSRCYCGGTTGGAM